MLQRLGEVGEPLRIGDIADQLQMTPVAVARAVDRLVEREWAVRLASPRDRKAVFAAAMPQGERQQRIIVRTVALLARKHLWSRLDRRQRHALARTWRIVIADVQKRAQGGRAQSRARSSNHRLTRTPSAHGSPMPDFRVKTFSAPEKRRARRSHFLFTAIGGKILPVKYSRGGLWCTNRPSTPPTRLLQPPWISPRWWDGSHPTPRCPPRPSSIASCVSKPYTLLWLSSRTRSQWSR